MRRGLVATLVWGAVACGSGQPTPTGPVAPPVGPAPVASSAVPVVVAVEPAARGVDPRDGLAMPAAASAEMAFREAGAALGVAALGRKALDDRGVLEAAAVKRVAGTGVTEDQLLGWIQGMAPSCRVPDGARSVPECVGAPSGELRG